MPSLRTGIGAQGERVMALSSGARRAAGMAAGWLVAAGSAAFSLVYFSEIKEAARDLLGLQAPSSAQTVATKRSNRDVQLMPSAARGRTVEIRAGAYGHHHASVEINGRSVSVMVDTGASIVALTFDDAERAGLFIRDSDYTQRVNTANGLARIAPVMLDRISIGDITVRNVPAAVSEPGKLSTSLLGMSFLSRLQRVDMRSGVLVLQE
jgi:aspartyl protease family protein